MALTLRRDEKGWLRLARVRRVEGATKHSAGPPRGADGAGREQSPPNFRRRLFFGGPSRCSVRASAPLRPTHRDRSEASLSWWCPRACLKMAIAPKTAKPLKVFGTVSFTWLIFAFLILFFKKGRVCVWRRYIYIFNLKAVRMHEFHSLLFCVFSILNPSETRVQNKTLCSSLPSLTTVVTDLTYIICQTKSSNELLSHFRSKLLMCLLLLETALNSHSFTHDNDFFSLINQISTCLIRKKRKTGKKMTYCFVLFFLIYKPKIIRHLLYVTHAQKAMAKLS